MQPSSGREKRSFVVWVLAVTALVGAALYQRSISMAQSAAETQTAIAEATAAKQTAIAESTTAAQRALNLIVTQTQRALDRAATQTAIAPTEIALQTQNAPVNNLKQICSEVTSTAVENTKAHGPIWIIGLGISTDNAGIQGYAASPEEATVLVCVVDTGSKPFGDCQYMGSMYSIKRSVNTADVKLVDIPNREIVARTSVTGQPGSCPFSLTDEQIRSHAPITGLPIEFYNIAQWLHANWSP